MRNINGRIFVMIKIKFVHVAEDSKFGIKFIKHLKRKCFYIVLIMYCRIGKDVLVVDTDEA